MVIGRGRRREYPNQHCLLLLRVLHNFRLRIPKGTPKGSSDLRSHPVVMVLLLRKTTRKKAGHAQNLLPVRATSWRGQVTFGSHVTTTTKKKARYKAGHAHNLLPDRATSRQVLFRSRDFVTSGQKAILGRIWHNFRLRMPRTYFRRGHLTYVTSGHVTSGCSTANNNWAVPIYYWQSKQSYIDSWQRHTFYLHD
jgi:hypothetical protein